MTIYPYCLQAFTPMTPSINSLGAYYLNNVTGVNAASLSHVIIHRDLDKQLGQIWNI